MVSIKGFHSPRLKAFFYFTISALNFLLKAVKPNGIVFAFFAGNQFFIPMKTLVILMLGFCSFTALAQNKGEKVYVEAESTNQNVKEIIEDFKGRLTEWGYWTVTDKKANADFSIRITAETSRGVTATSWGGTSVAGSVELFDRKGKPIWLSDTYKSSPNGSNGFNSKKAVVKKLINALKKKYK